MAAVPFGNTSLFLSTVAAGTLKAYYPGDDLLDYSGNNKTLTKTGTVNHAAAKFANGFSANFGHTTDHLHATSVLTPGTGDFAIGGWFLKNGGPSSDFTPTVLFLGDGGGSVSAILYATKTNGYAGGQLYNAGANTITSTTNICDNAQHLIGFQRIGTTIKVYVDGNEVASGTSSKNISTGEIHIGFNGQASGFDNIQTALIDDVFAISRGLTAQEWTDLYSGALEVVADETKSIIII